MAQSRHAYVKPTTGMTKLRLGYVASCGRTAGRIEIVANRLTIELGSSGIVIVSTDDSGYHLTNRIPASPAGCDVWTRDLDSNGRTDLLIATFNNGVDVTLTVLLFDASGKAVPWVVDGPLNTHRNGIEELVDEDRDGRAEIVLPSHGSEGGLRELDWTLYRFRDSSVERFDGHYGARRFPVLSKGSTLSKLADLTVRIARSASAKSGTIRAVDPRTCGIPLESKECQFDWIQLADVSLEGASGGKHRIRIPEMAVVEEEKGRRIVLLSESEKQDGLRSLIGRQLFWREYGLLEERPFLVLITVRPSIPNGQK